jgi:hypothetical protein
VPQSGKGDLANGLSMKKQKSITEGLRNGGGDHRLEEDRVRVQWP